MSRPPAIAQKDRTRQRRADLAADGLKRVEIWVKRDQVALVQSIAASLRHGATVRVGPAITTVDVGPQTKRKKDSPMETMTEPWTFRTLKQALETSEGLLPGEFDLAILEGASEVLEVAVDAAGGVQLFVAVEGEHIMTSTILWSREQQQDPEAFEALMLRKHKVLLPLSALAIETIGGREYYELFGSMSARSILPSIITEFRTLANNALELAQEMGPGALAAVEG